MVAGVRPDYPSDWPAICAVAEKLGIGTAETLRKWVRQAEVDAGTRPGLTSEEHAEIKRLKRENAELCRANEILKAASVSSRQSSTGTASLVRSSTSTKPARWARRAAPVSSRSAPC